MRLLTALTIILLPITGALADWSIADMNRHIDQTNFQVNDGCSGTLIDLEKRFVLTANHCITAQYETIEREKIADDGSLKTEKVRRLKPGTVRQLVFSGALQVQQNVYRTEVVAFDSQRDLALLKIQTHIPNTIAAKFSCDEPVRGNRVFIVGNPMGNLYSSVVTGIVSSLQRTYGMINFGEEKFEATPLMQISGGVIGGNSGGSVYNDQGHLIGVPVIAHRANETLGFAVPLADIKAFLTEKKLEGVFGYCSAK